MAILPAAGRKPILIPQPSAMSLYLELFAKGMRIGRGTGFVIVEGSRPYLVTNRHLVTGLHQETNEVLSRTGMVPDTIHVSHNGKAGLGTWVVIQQSLYDANDVRAWLEHPALGVSADVVLLPLDINDNVELVPYGLDVEGSEIMIEPTSIVSVVGYPFGRLPAGGFAIWATGTIASTPEFDYDGKPAFLIDCRSRQGQSGSAVIAYRSAGQWVGFTDGKSAMVGKPVWNFLGVYSGRINIESDLGIVWKPSVMRDIANAHRAGRVDGGTGEV